MIKQEITTEESIARILTTPLLQRVNMPNYGSRLFELVDNPVTDEWILLAQDYTYDAVERNELRVEIKNVSINVGDAVTIEIQYMENGVDKSLNLNFGEVGSATT
jgi:phage baseplate assembly protein W